MSHYFLDSSTLVKRYVPEIGTRWVRTITARGSGNDILVAQVTQVEVVSATRRRVRDGSISVRTAQATRLLIDRHMQHELRVIGLTSMVIASAEDLLEVYPLRAYDAVQLASALSANMRLKGVGLTSLVFVSSDQRLLTAATSEGLLTDDPLGHP